MLELFNQIKEALDTKWPGVGEHVILNGRKWLIKNIHHGRYILELSGFPALSLDPLQLQTWIESGKIQVTESSIDFPQPGLDPTIWNKVGEVYTIKPDVKEKIIQYAFHSFQGDIDLESLTETIHIVGSITTNQWVPNSDIDVHLVPKSGKISSITVEQVAAVKKWSHNNPDYINQHPMELYLQTLPDQDLLGDSCYDLFSDKWLKTPHIVGADYDPYKVYAEIMKMVQEAAKKADVDIGELKRDVIDYSAVATAVKSFSDESKTGFRKLLTGKLDEIEMDIDKLLADKKEWVEMRHNASKPTSKEQALNDVNLARKWQDANALFKFLDRYQYISLITELEELAKDGIDDEDVDKIAQTMGVTDVGS